MEEVIKKIKENNFSNEGKKIAYAIGYMHDNPKVNKKEALEIIREIIMGEI